jgi:hypothetical protein
LLSRWPTLVHTGQICPGPCGIVPVKDHLATVADQCAQTLRYGKDPQMGLHRQPSPVGHPAQLLAYRVLPRPRDQLGDDVPGERAALHPDRE